MFDFHLFQIGMGPVPFDRRSVIDTFSLGCAIAPDPCPICPPSLQIRLCLLSAQVDVAYTVVLPPLARSHISSPTMRLSWSQTYRSSEFEGFCRIDRTIVAGPSSNDRIDGLYFVRILIVGGAPFGHRLDRGLVPASPPYRWDAQTPRPSGDWRLYCSEKREILRSQSHLRCG